MNMQPEAHNGRCCLYSSNVMLEYLDILTNIDVNFGRQKLSIQLPIAISALRLLKKTNSATLQAATFLGIDGNDDGARGVYRENKLVRPSLLKELLERRNERYQASSLDWAVILYMFDLGRRVAFFERAWGFASMRVIF